MSDDEKSARVSARPDWILRATREGWSGTFLRQADALTLELIGGDRCKTSKMLAAIFYAGPHMRQLDGNMEDIADLAGMARSTAFKVCDDLIAAQLIGLRAKEGRNGGVSLSIRRRLWLHLLVVEASRRNLVRSADIALNAYLLSGINVTTRRGRIEDLGGISDATGISLRKLEAARTKLRSDRHWNYLGDEEFELKRSEIESDSLPTIVNPNQALNTKRPTAESSRNSENNCPKIGDDLVSDSFTQFSDSLSDSFDACMYNYKHTGSEPPDDVLASTPDDSSDEWTPDEVRTTTTPTTNVHTSKPAAISTTDIAAADGLIARGRAGEGNRVAVVRDFIAERTAAARGAGRSGLSGDSVFASMRLAAAGVLVDCALSDKRAALDAFRGWRAMWPAGHDGAAVTIVETVALAVAQRLAGGNTDPVSSWSWFSPAIRRRIDALPKCAMPVLTSPEPEHRVSEPSAKPAPTQNAYAPLDRESRIDAVLEKLFVRFKRLMPPTNLSRQSSAGFWAPYLREVAQPEEVLKIADFAYEVARAQPGFRHDRFRLKDLWPTLDETFPNASKQARRSRYPSQQRAGGVSKPAHAH